MNFQRLLHRLQLLVVLATTAFIEDVAAYDVPAFHAAPFDRDGIFLEDGDRQSLLEALASVAANFPGSSSVDEDLVEKALAIALTIDPFHGNSRQAHEKLSAGDTPPGTPYFDSRSAAAEALWAAAIQLLTPPVEPEAKKLAPLLMEISLLIHPAPTIARILQFDQLADEKENAWKGFVSLQENIYVSNERLQLLRREAKNARREEMVTTEIAEPNPKPAPKPRVPAAMLPVAGTIREDQRQISGVFPAPAGPYVGTFSLEVRAPLSTEEAASFPFLHELKVEKYPVLPILVTGEADLPFIGVRFDTDRNEAYGITWQQGAIGLAGFEVIGNLPEDPDRGEGVPVSLPLILSLKSISESRPLNPSIGLIGAYQRRELTQLPILNPVEVITLGAQLDKPYLLIPSDTLPTLLETLSSDENLGPLFLSDLLSYETMEQAYEVLTLTDLPTPLVEASKIFAEIKSVSARMPLPELARNDKVQERLEAILELVPNHYSAKAMLEFGRKPASNTAILNPTIVAIDAVIDPYFTLRKEFRADMNMLRNQVAAADQELSRLRPEIPAEARNYHTHAVDMIDAAAIYLEFSNKTTSIAEQRLRELNALLDQLDSERERLGLAPRAEVD